MIAITVERELEPEATNGADLGGSSKYSSENLED